MASAHLRQEVLDKLYKILKDPLTYGDRNLLHLVNEPKDGLVSVRLVHSMTHLLDPYPVKYVEHCLQHDSEQRFRLSIDFTRVGLKDNAQYYETNALGFIEEDLEDVDTTIPQEVRPVIYDNGRFYIDEEHTRLHRASNKQFFEYDRVDVTPIGKLRSVNMYERLSCYNCGRSGHHVRDCIQPIDYNRIKRQTDRLFKSVERDSMQPGLLSQRVKEALDMSEGDEPPYYSKMRRYGYPPGYLTHSSKTNDTEMPLLKVYDGQYVIHTKDQGKNEQTHSIRSVEYPGLYTHIIPEQSERERNPDPPTDEQMHTIQQQWNEYYHYYYLQNYQHTYYASEPLPPGVEHEANTTNTQAFLIENSINPIDLTVLGNDNDNGNDDQSVDMDISSGDEG